MTSSGKCHSCRHCPLKKVQNMPTDSLQCDGCGYMFRVNRSVANLAMERDPAPRCRCGGCLTLCGNEAMDTGVQHTIRVARFNEHDIGNIAAALVAHVLEMDGRAISPKNTRAGVWRELKEQRNTRYYVAENAGEFCGQCQVSKRFDPAEGGQVWYLARLFVVPAMRRQGIGSKILRRVQVDATRSGDVAEIWGHAYSENGPIVSLFRDADWQPISTHYSLRLT